MSNHTSDGAAPSLVEVFKPLAREWRSLHEQAQAIRDRGAAEALWDRHFDKHPLVYLFRLIEEHTGIQRKTLEQVAWRINTPPGLAPHTFIQRPPTVPECTDPELDSFLDADQPNPHLTDLLWIYGKFTECDINGTTATILRRFDAKHPEAMGANKGAIAGVGQVPDGRRQHEPTGIERRRGRPPKAATKEGQKKKKQEMKLFRDYKAASNETGMTKSEFLRERGLTGADDAAALERGRKHVAKE